jgi:hypothetical protein
MTLRVKVKGGGQWGDPTFQWGVNDWGVTSEQDQAIVRGRSIGSAYAVAFLVEGGWRERGRPLDRWELLTETDDLLETEDDAVLVGESNALSFVRWGGFDWDDGVWTEVRDGVPRWGVNAIDLVYLPRAVR